MISPRRILLVSPSFHGYWRAIATALEARGHVVTTVRYDANDQLGDKLRHKLQHELPARILSDWARQEVSAMTTRTLQALREVRPEIVVIVKGDQLGDAVWEELDQQRLPRIVWLYDELRRTHLTTDRLREIGPVASYSRRDVAALQEAGVDAEHLPLAHDTSLAWTRRTSPEVVFVGARYPSREHLLCTLHDRGVLVRAYGRDWSGHPVDRLRTWRVGRPSVPAGRQLTRAEAYGHMAGARATLNVHGDQDGFTMRTFEACGVGALQLVDRADVADLYEPGGEIVPFEGPDELVELAQRAVTDRPWTDRIREAARRRTEAEHTFAHRVVHLEQRWA